jgi:hypothetical protein
VAVRRIQRVGDLDGNVERGLGVERIDADVGTEPSDDIVILKPNEPTTIIFSGLLTPDLVSLASRRELVARFKVFYRGPKENAPQEYTSSAFLLDKTTVVLACCFPITSCTRLMMA